MIKRVAALMTAGVICAGLAGCTAQGLDATSHTTAASAPTVSPSETLATVHLSVTKTQESSPPENLATPAVVLLQGSSTALLTPGHVSYVQIRPRTFCNTLESLFGAVPNAYLRDLPVWGAVYLPGCLVGQIPTLPTTTGSTVVVAATMLPTRTLSDGQWRVSGPFPAHPRSPHSD
jgi:hypothetical protein